MKRLVIKPVSQRLLCLIITEQRTIISLIQIFVFVFYLSQKDSWQLEVKLNIFTMRHVLGDFYLLLIQITGRETLYSDIL
jgi:hypothetical protein